MKVFLVHLLLTIALIGSPAFSGDLEPPGAPAPTMKTLDQVYSAAGTGTGAAFQFVGTTTPATPDLGVLGMTRRCQSEFGAGTRMCTSLEVMDSYILPSKSAWNSTKGWVKPVIQGAYYTGTQHRAVDFSGVTKEAESGLSCNGWRTTGANGLGIHAPDAEKEGQFANIPCNDASTGVACCGMVAP